MGWAGYGSRQAASEKCPWSVTTLCSFFSLSLSLSLLRPRPAPRAMPTPGGGERIRNE